MEYVNIQNGKCRYVRTRAITGEMLKNNGGPEYKALGHDPKLAFAAENLQQIMAEQHSV